MKISKLFNQILYIHQKKQKHPTLGGRSFFHVKTKGENLEITNSKGKNRLVDYREFDIIFSRYKALQKTKKENKAAFYTDTHWEKHICPNRIFSPYVAMIIHTLQKN